MPSRHRTERGSAGSNLVYRRVLIMIDPALPRSVLCLFGTTNKLMYVAQDQEQRRETLERQRIRSV